MQLCDRARKSIVSCQGIAIATMADINSVAIFLHKSTILNAKFQVEKMNLGKNELFERRKQGERKFQPGLGVIFHPPVEL